MLGAAPKSGLNTILITHKPNIVDALGGDWFDVKEARPRSSVLKVVTSSSPGCKWDEWPRVAMAAN